MIKFPQTVLSFAANNKTAYEMFVNYWNRYVHMNGGKEREYQKLGQDGRPLSFSEMENQMNEALRAEVARISGVSFDASISMEQWALNPMVSWATFAVVSGMIDMVLPDALIDSIGLYTDIINISWGDSSAFTIKPRDLFVVSKSGHGQKSSEVHKQFDTTVTIVPEPHQITVQVALYKVLCGKESLAEFTAKAIKSIEAQMARDAYDVFAAAMGNLSVVGAATYSYMKVVGFTQDALISLAQRVQAWNGGAKPVLAGTARALRYILPDDGNYRYDLESEYVKVGHVRTFSDFSTMVLDQFADWTVPFSTVLNDANLYVISPSVNKLLKLVIEGSTLSNVTQPFDNSNLTQNATFIKNWKAAVATNAVAGLMTVA
jgi:hypothetical protein